VLIRTLASFEWRIARRDPAVLIVYAAWIAVIVFASVQGAGQLRAAEATRAELTARETARDADYAARAAASTALLAGAPVTPLERWVRHGPTHPMWLGRSWGARLIQSPVAPLSALVAGNVSSPASYRIGTDMPIELERNGAHTEHPLRQVLGRIDLGFVALFGMPLLIVAWLRDVLASERDGGTLALVRAQGVSPVTLALVRTAWRGAVIVLPLVVAGLVTATLATTVIVSAASPWLLLRGTFWTGLVVCYALFWLAVAYRTAAAGWSAATSGLVLAACWCVVCLVLPPAVQSVAAEAAPLPSRAEMFSVSRAADAEAATTSPATLLATYGETDPVVHVGRARMAALREFPLASAEQTLIIDARQHYVSARLAPAFALLEAQRASQQRVAAWLSLISPASVTYAALVELSGAGDTAVKHFEAGAREFHARWRAFFLPRGLTMTPLTSADYARLPRFSMRDTSFADLLPIVARAGGVLMLLALILVRGGSKGLRLLDR